MGAKSGSLSMMHGTPGTGKTRTNISLASCIINSSRFGHLGTEEQTSNLISKDGKKVLVDTGSDGRVRILISAPSNQAVDTICKELMKEGVIDMRTGERVEVEAIRVGRDNYDYKDLLHLSADEKVGTLHCNF